MNPSEVEKPTEISNPVLIQFILDRYHAKHREQLGPLMDKAQAIEATGEREEQLKEDLLNTLSEVSRALEEHMRKEEVILFPSMLSNAEGIGCALEALRHEHDEHERRIEDLVEVANRVLASGPDTAEKESFANAMQTLIHDLMEHIQIENEVLFARFATPVKCK